MCQHPRPDTIVPHDRRTITATIIGVGEQDHRTRRYRATIAHIDGWTSTGLIPWHEKPTPGQQVTMTVTLHPSEFNPTVSRYVRASRVHIGAPYTPSVGDTIILNRKPGPHVPRWQITVICGSTYTVRSLTSGRTIFTTLATILNCNTGAVAPTV